MRRRLMQGRFAEAEERGGQMGGEGGRVQGAERGGGLKQGQHVQAKGGSVASAEDGVMITVRSRTAAQRDRSPVIVLWRSHHGSATGRCQCTPS